MILEGKIPSPGESITEVQLAAWLVEDGAFVEKDDEIAEVESDKATLMLVAEESGKIAFKVGAGETVAVGTIAYTIDTSVEGTEIKKETTSDENKMKEEVVQTKVKEKEPETKTEDKIKVTPVAEEVMKENNLNIDDVLNGLRRISKQDVQAVIGSKTVAPEITETFSREEERSTMTMLRKRISERLVSVKNETAMLTTFNEIDMSTVMNLRKTMQDTYVKKYGSKLGFMGFFTKAVSIAAKFFPAVNSRIEGEEIIVPHFVDVGIAVQTPKGLMVPIVRNAESKSIPQIEQDIKDLAEKARNKKISMHEMSGGTISITNGGVFGSLLSTPIINPPQSAILGMHNIVERPVAVDGQVVIRPMMYVALSYDHRIIDGKDSVGFLLKVKELIEKPELIATEGINPGKKILGL